MTGIQKYCTSAFRSNKPIHSVTSPFSVAFEEDCDYVLGRVAGNCLSLTPRGNHPSPLILKINQGPGSVWWTVWLGFVFGVISWAAFFVSLLGFVLVAFSWEVFLVILLRIQKH